MINLETSFSTRDAMYQSFNARAVGLANLPVETTIKVAAGAGFDAVDLMIRDLVRSGTDLPRLRDQMGELGLRGGAFPMTMDWRGDEASFRRDLAELPKLAKAASFLGLTRTGTWVMPETPTMPPPGADPAKFRAEVTAFHVDRIGAIARVLADHGIKLGLEVIGVSKFRRGTGVPFITRMSDLVPTLEAIWDQPNVGLLGDVFHLYAAGEPITQALGWGVDRVVWVHVADLPRGAAIDRKAIIDAERGLPGKDGTIDCRAFLRMLQEAGYDGPVTAEPLARCESLVGHEPDDVARRVKSAMDECWPGASR